MIDGRLERLACGTDPLPARYALQTVPESAAGPEALADPFGAAATALELRPGQCLEIEWLGRCACVHCGQPTRKRYGGGHCYDCFRRLARCDLCVVDPVRCHYARGTCREPDWGRSFCQQPHLVYLAHSSGPKVGITREGRQRQRWLDQGAVAALPLARAATRELAGRLEADLARRISDRTDWRLLVGQAPEPVDLRALARQLRARADLPDGVEWLPEGPVVELTYPVHGFPRTLQQFALERDGTVAGRLLGIKGGYLLFEHGVLNVPRHRGCVVRVREVASEGLRVLPPQGADQMELFA